MIRLSYFRVMHKALDSAAAPTRRFFMPKLLCVVALFSTHTRRDTIVLRHDMKVFVLAVAVLIFSCVGESRPVHVKGPGQDALLFIEGVAEGLEVEIGNITVCTADLNITLDDYELAFSEIKNGIRHVDVHEVEKGLKHFGDGTLELAKAFKACGFATLAEEIEKIASELSQGIGGIVEVIAKEVINIFHHSKELTSDFKAAISAWESKDFKTSGFYTGEIIGILLQE